MSSHSDSECDQCQITLNILQINIRDKQEILARMPAPALIVSPASITMKKGNLGRSDETETDLVWIIIKVNGREISTKSRHFVRNILPFIPT